MPNWRSTPEPDQRDLPFQTCRALILAVLAALSSACAVYVEDHPERYEQAPQSYAPPPYVERRYVRPAPPEVVCLDADTHERIPCPPRVAEEDPTGWIMIEKECKKKHWGPFEYEKCKPTGKVREYYPY